MPARRRPTSPRSRARPARSARSRSPPPAASASLMVGPPGTGKSMLAQRFVALLPALGDDEALESAAVLSLTGAFSMQRWGQRVLRAPHHSASSAALVGGGSPPRPGEITLAHHGVLFLDELPEFPRARARGAARAARDRADHDLARRAPGRLPGALPAARRDEPVPVRPPRQPAARLPLHARRGRALPGPDQRAAARPHRPAGRGAGGRRRRAVGARRTASRARVDRGARRRGARATRGRARAALNAQLARRCARPPCRARRRRRCASCRRRRRGSAGRRAASTASCAAPARSPTSPAATAIRPPHLAEAIQYRRVLASSRARRPTAQSARVGRGPVPLDQEAEVGRREVRQVREDRVELASRRRRTTCRSSRRSGRPRSTAGTGCRPNRRLADRTRETCRRSRRRCTAPPDDEVVRAPAVVGAVAVAGVRAAEVRRGEQRDVAAHVDAAERSPARCRSSRSRARGAPAGRPGSCSGARGCRSRPSRRRRPAA